MGFSVRRPELLDLLRSLLTCNSTSEQRKIHLFRRLELAEEQKRWEPR